MEGKELNINDEFLIIDMDKININNKEQIQFVEFHLDDTRLDLLIIKYYGINYNVNYGISRELFLNLILSFNDINNLIDAANQKIKLPNIYQLLLNVIDIDSGDYVGGVYEFINPNEEYKKITEQKNDLISELKRRVSKVKYDKETGFLKF